MDPELLRIVERVRKDTVHGASSVAIDVAGSLLNLMVLQQMPSTLDLVDFCNETYDVRRSMAPLFSVLNTLLLDLDGPETNDAKKHVIFDHLDQFVRRERKANEDIAARFDHILSKNKVATISNSSAVTAALIKAGRTRALEVMVLESLPGGEGFEMAKALTAAGIECSVTPDSMAYVAARWCDVMVCGADSISKRFVVNKTGTHALAGAARHMGVSAFVLASNSKLVPFDLFDPMEVDGRKEGVPFRSQMFEGTPLDTFDLLITGTGSYAPSAAAKLISNFKVAGSWRMETSKSDIRGTR